MHTFLPFKASYLLTVPPPDSQWCLVIPLPQLQLAEAKAVNTFIEVHLVGASTNQSTFWPIEVKVCDLLIFIS
jgi:hypothetical protein